MNCNPTARVLRLLPLLLALALLSCSSGNGGNGGGDSGGSGDDASADAGGDVAEDALADIAESGGDPAPDAAPDAPDGDGLGDADPDSGPDADAVDSPDSPPDVVETGADASPDPDTTGIDTPPGSMSLLSVTPRSGPITGGTDLVLSGTGFTPDTDILINGVIAEDIDVVDGYMILARTPPNPEGTYDIKAINGVAQALLPSAFTYYAPVRLDSVDPAIGPERGGNPVTVLGAGFAPGTTVSIGGRAGMDVRVRSVNRIDLVAPPGTAGRADVRVTNPNGSEVLPRAYTYYAEARVDEVEPPVGLFSGGYDATIRGVGFDQEATVLFGSVDATEVRFVDSQTLSVRVPIGAPGPVDVTVITGSTGGDTLEGGFVYLAAGAGLELAGVIPAAGATTGGDEVRLVGRGLDAVDQVLFGTAPATIVAQAANVLTVTTPARPAGTVDVRVSNESDSDTLLEAFTYVSPLRVTEVAPASGPVEGGNEVAVLGAGFTDETRVSFGPVFASDVRRESSSRILATVPPGTVGPVDVMAHEADRRATLEDGYAYLTDVAFTGMSPSRGSMSGNTYVLLRGTGFVGEVGVTFGDIPAASFEVLDPSTIAARTPPHEPGPATVTVTVNGTPYNGPNKFYFYDPFSAEGGWWGDGILGSVNVSVRDANSGEPVEDAFVTLHLREHETQYSGITDALGLVTISGPDLSGAQVVTATHRKYSSATINAVNAENVTVYLSKICPCYSAEGCLSPEVCAATPYMVTTCRDTTRCDRASDCEGGYVCVSGTCQEKCWCGCGSDGECYSDDDECVDYPSMFPPAGRCTPVAVLDCESDLDCEGTGYGECFRPNPLEPGRCVEDCRPPSAPPTGNISGMLTGMDKIDDPAPGEMIMGVVLTSTPDAFSENPNPGGGNTVMGDGPYTLVSRLGDVVVIGVCGVYNNATAEFRPLYMGIYRPLNVRSGGTYTADIECDIPLDQTMTFKLISPPRGLAGTNINQVIPFLDFGGEGAFGGLVVAEGTTEVLSATGFPALEGALAEVTWFIYGGAFGETGFPFSVGFLWNQRDVEGLITLPPLVPPARLLQPSPMDPVVVGRRIEWTVDTDTLPDFYYVMIQDETQQTTFWEVWLPGDQVEFNLPFFPEEAIEGPLPIDVPLVLLVLAVDALAFDYEHFEYNDFSLLNWSSYSANGWFVYVEE